MDNRFSPSNIDNLLFQLALQTRELSQKKNEINQQIKVCRADIAERTSYIETVHRNIKTLEEDIRMKQSTLIHNKANAKSMKATNSLLLQYEQTLKAELESRKASYNHDIREVYEQRIASYRKIFQSHKEYHCQSPQAQKLFGLQAEKEEIECRIKACDDQIAMKQKALDHLTGAAVSSSSAEKPPDSASDQQPLTEAERQFNPQTEEASDSAIDISSLHLNQTKNGQKSVEAKAGDIHEEHKAQDTTTCSPHSDDARSELCSCEQLNEQSWPGEMHTDEQEKETELQEQEQQSAVSEVEEAVEANVEAKVEARAGTDECQTPSQEDNEGLHAFPHSSSQETNPQSSVAEMASDHSTPIFPFSFSPTGSPHRGTSDTTAPAFPFSLSSHPSTPAFSGFGFDAGTSQDEGTPFSFTGSFFNEKKSTDPKSPSCPEFLFDQSEHNEDFQFTFTSKSSGATNKDNTTDGFPFSFNF